MFHESLSKTKRFNCFMTKSLSKTFWLCWTHIDDLLVGFGPYWTNLDQFGPFCLFVPVYVSLFVWTCVYGPVYLDLYIWIRLFGPVSLDPCIWTHLFGPVYLNPSIWMRLLGPVYLNPPTWTCLFRPVYLNPSLLPVYLDLSVWTRFQILTFGKCNTRGKIEKFKSN